MHVEWAHSFCLVCLEESPLSNEHIIPASIGGKLTSNLLCTGCNSRFGHAFENKTPLDPAIRIAAINLRSQIPKVATSIIEHAELISYGPGGTGKGKIKAGVYQEKARREPDGSIIQPTHLARESLIKRMGKAGVDQRQIARALEVFDKAPENTKITLSGGIGFVKWSIDKIEPAFYEGVFLNDLVLVKIAFEYLALHVGAALLSDESHIVDIREALLSGRPSSPAFAVDKLSSREYSSHHGVAIDQGDPHVIVHIMLFGWLRFKVHFHHLAMDAKRIAYTHDLRNGAEFLNDEQYSSP